jgi:hypothetical protein
MRTTFFISCDLSCTVGVSGAGGERATAIDAARDVRFLCLAPTGHVCQFSVRTGAGPVDFALPSGERREVAGIAPYSDKYCVCDPGPVTPDCKAPRLDHWCLGEWLDVTRELNSRNVQPALGQRSVGRLS